MGRKKAAAALAGALLLAGLLPAGAVPAKVDIQEQYVLAGGNGPWYTEESYWADPVVADLDGDGRLEAVNAAYTLSVVDAATGALKWKVNAGRDRATPYDDFGNAAGQVFCTPKVGDVDGDGKPEIAVGYSDGSVSLLDGQGYFKPGWPRRCSSPLWPAGSGVGVRSLALGDLDGDGKLEIVAGIGVTSAVSVFVFRHDGSLAPGWPQLQPEQDGAKLPYAQKLGNAYSYGLFSDSISLGDLDGDDLPEIVAPTDTAYIDAYHYDGSLVDTCAAYGGRAWGKIALYEDYGQELACVNEGWGWPLTGGESRAELYRAELGHAASVFADVDGDGRQEVVVTAPMTDRTAQATTGVVTLADMRYTTVFILNADRTRFQKEPWDWSAAPRDLGRPLKSDDQVSMVGGVIPRPVCADMDADGKLEILFNSFDGKLHCFWLDGTEHGAWPFVLPKSGGGLYEYPSVPAVADLDGDGELEVAVASWTDRETGEDNRVDGALYVLSAGGELLASRDLHPGYKTYEGDFVHANGVMGGVTLRDVDGDGKLEALVNTTYYALCAYELTAQGQVAGNLAYPSVQTVTVDGRRVEFQMYALKDEKGYPTNYVKLRDLASVMGSFSVGWDSAAGVVRVQTRKPYVPNGSEMSTPFSGPRLYTRPAEPIDVDSKDLKLDLIRLTDDAGNGYSYYKLRDLGDALGFRVDWSAEAGISVTSGG